MPRTKKTKSSLLAQGIELIESGVKKIKEFNESIDPFLLDADKLKQIKPLVENLAKTLAPPEPEQVTPDQEPPPGPDQETPDQETPPEPDQETPDQETPDPELNVCLICVHTCEPDKRPEGTIILDGLVKSCPAFTLTAEPTMPKKKFERMKKLLKNATPEPD